MDFDEMEATIKEFRAGMNEDKYPALALLIDRNAAYEELAECAKDYCDVEYDVELATFADNMTEYEGDD